MADAAETTETLPIGAVEGQPGVTVVSQENFQDYVTQELGAKAPAENEDPEAVAAQEFAKIEEKKAEEKAAEDGPREGDTDGSKVFFKGKWKDKSDFGYRLHLKEEEVKKAAKADIEKASSEAKTAREEAAKAAKERDELKAKYEPPKSSELGPEPKMGDYTDVADYLTARDVWVADKTRKEDAAKAEGVRQTQEREAAVKRWNERQEAVKTKIPDYEAKLAASPVMLSDQMRDAVIESEVGPEILAHFADNPAVADEMGKMTVAKMLREFGKLEVSIGGTEKPGTKSETKAPVVEISRAPAPITPLKGANHGSGLKVDAAGNWIGTFEEFKAADRAGKFN